MTTADFAFVHLCASLRLRWSGVEQIHLRKGHFFFSDSLFCHILAQFVYLYLFIFTFWHVACGILVPWPGIEPMPPALGAQNLNHWTTREVQHYFFFLNSLFWNNYESYLGSSAGPSSLYFLSLWTSWSTFMLLMPFPLLFDVIIHGCSAFLGMKSLSFGSLGHASL